MEHPVITSFLHAKWKTIQPYYLVKSAGVVLFQIILTTFVYLLHRDPDQAGTEALRWILFLMTLGLVATLIPIWITHLRESFNNKDPDTKTTYVSFKPFLKALNTEEIMKNLLVVGVFLLVFWPGETADKERVASLSATTVLISWVWGIYFIANFPIFAVYGAMFSRISKKNL